MTELSFLVDLLLNHRLPKPTREAVAARIKEVEAAATRPVHMHPTTYPHAYPGLVDPVKGPCALPPEIAKQAPSMQAIMMRHADLVAQQSVGTPTSVEAQQIAALQQRSPNEQLQQPAIVAQTPAAAAAMASRNQAIAESLAGKVDKTTGRPRKF